MNRGVFFGGRWDCLGVFDVVQARFGSLACQLSRYPAILEVDRRGAKEVRVDRRLQDKFAIIYAEVVIDPLPFGVGVYTIADGEWDSSAFVHFFGRSERTLEISGKGISIVGRVRIVVKKIRSLLNPLKIERLPGRFLADVAAMIVPYRNLPGCFG